MEYKCFLNALLAHFFVVRLMHTRIYCCGANSITDYHAASSQYTGTRPCISLNNYDVFQVLTTTVSYVLH